MTNATPPPAPAGWYPSPSGEPNSVSYWDGSTWTENRRLEKPAVDATLADTGAESATPVQPSRRGALIGIGVVVALVLAAIVAYNVFIDGIEDEAMDRCSSAAANQLKSPSTAEFSNVTAHETDSLKTMDEDFSTFDEYKDFKELSRWVVTGDIDASNSYGATVRSDFNCSAIVGDGRIVGIEFGFIQ
ncbi:DUF2510 domain-containing protein [Rhodococcus sp. 1168]|uniref:DUF2510 domain-containing protein n=1 Tax=Rhodococcus sp. 1168 TaxID=2018041 RepID=UPI0015932170|nr:DUF2510 domain-containing protein [Rhodococcus sp. 1168]